MPDPETSPQPPDADSGTPNGLLSLLSTVTGGITDAPILTASIGVIGVIAVLSGLAVGLGGAFTWALGAVCGVFVLAVAASFAWRRNDPAPPGAEEHRTELRARGARGVRISDSGNIEGGSGSVSTDLRRARDVELRRSQNVRAAGPPATPLPPPAPAPVPGPAARPDSEAAGGYEETGAGAPPVPGCLTGDPADSAAFTPSLLDARDRILRAAAARRGSRFDIRGDSGCGKTALLELVADGLKAAGHLVLFITAAAPQYGTGQAAGEEERAVADYAACRYLIDALAADVHRAYHPEDGSTPLMEEAVGLEWETALLACRTAGEPPAPGGQHIHVDLSRARGVDLGNVGNITLPAAVPQPGGRRLAAMQRQLTDVLDRMSRAPSSGGLAVLVDDVQTVLGTPVGGWLLSVLSGLGAARVVVHGRRPHPDPGPFPPGTRTIRLDPMSEGEASDLVTARLTGGGRQPRDARACATVVAEVTGGHPIGVVTCCQIVLGSLPPDTPPAAVRRHLLHGDQRWDSGGFAGVRAFVDGHAAQVAGRPLPLFDLLTVLRRCTPQLLGPLLAEDGLGPDAFGELYDWLTHSAFVTSFDDDNKQEWRLHDYLRENLDARFAAERPTAHAAVHGRVERLYRGRMNFDDAGTDDADAGGNGSAEDGGDEAEGAYDGAFDTAFEGAFDTAERLQPISAGYRYEDPVWLRNLQEWLHHAAHVAPQRFAAARRAMIRLFLEGFFWWDCEVPSGYCSHLVSTYRSLPDRSGLRWVDWLEDFRTSYVAGAANQRVGEDTERWDAAAAALDDLFHFLGIRAGHRPDDPDLRRVYLVGGIMRGDAAWFSGHGTTADRDQAGLWYSAAHRACTDEAELWIRNWAAVGLAVIHASADPDAAEAYLDGVQEAALEAEDKDVLNSIAQAYGAIAWARGDLRAAFDCHIRAVLHAYVYHVDQEVYGQYPSNYTASVHRGVCAALEERASAAREAGRSAEADAAQARSRAFFAPYWAYRGCRPRGRSGCPSRRPTRISAVTRPPSPTR
ncbi:hypothetical protein [Actinacidiphila yeochonensis]|uniref:hypothetical protein n=1 Tax=Actinacidiphila yeochonensis TaxID=89050 RepID=UPI00068B4408|nr:hypothetical protein [Actinacidiphila yeochonensis]